MPRFTGTLNVHILTQTEGSYAGLVRYRKLFFTPEKPGRLYIPETHHFGFFLFEISITPYDDIVKYNKDTDFHLNFMSPHIQKVEYFLMQKDTSHCSLQ